MSLVPPVIDWHLVERDIGDAARLLEAFQNIPKSLFDKIYAVDPKGCHRARPAKTDHSKDQFRAKMAEGEGASADNCGVIRRNMAVVCGQISGNKVTIVTLGCLLYTSPSPRD